jgi:two-component system, OmpR family, response regulator
MVEAVSHAWENAVRVLVVEDDPQLGPWLRDTLGTAFGSSDMVTTLEEGRAAVAVRSFELVVIDRGLPDGDGLALLRDLKQQKPSPATIVLTALDDPIDIARALDEGADDYVAKPFEPIELVARAKAVLRRLFLDRGAIVRIGNLSYDVLNREVCVDHQPIVVPRRELAILEAMVRRIGRVVLRETLEVAAYDFDDEIQDRHQTSPRPRISVEWRMMTFKWQTLKRIHRSIAVLSATLIGAVTTIMLICAAALLIRFGGDDDGTWAAADVADALKEAVIRNEAGQLALKPTSRLDEITRNFPTFWYVVSDKSGEVSYGPVPKWRPPKTQASRDGTSFLAYAFDGETTKLKKMAAVRNTPAGEVWIETGGVAYTASQLTTGMLTDATIVALPIIMHHNRLPVSLRPDSLTIRYDRA